MKKRFYIIVAIIFGLLIASYYALNFFINNYLAYSSIRPSRFITDYSIVNPSKLNLKYEDFSITVEDTIKLRGWYVYSGSIKPKGTIFLLHGIGSNRSAMLSNAKLLSSQGFNSVLYDSRACGKSGGLNCTFGYYEKEDLSSYIDSVQILFPNSEPYGALGHSLGAAVVLQALENDKRIKCAVIESSFADLRNIIHDYFARMFYIRIDCIPDKALERSEQIAHFKVDDVNPAKSALHIYEPVMIIHGLKDERISYKDGDEIFNNLKSPIKKWYAIKDAGHNNVSQVGGLKLDSAIVGFFNENLHN